MTTLVPGPANPAELALALRQQNLRLCYEGLARSGRRLATHASMMIRTVQQNRCREETSGDRHERNERSQAA